MSEFGPRPEPTNTLRAGTTPEGTSIAAELPWDITPADVRQIFENKTICVMGRGACPPECPLVEAGKKVFDRIPVGSDVKEVSSELRRRVVFGDAFDKSVTVVDVATVIGACVKENPQSSKE